MNKIAPLIFGLLLAFAGAAQSQVCACNAAAARPTAAALKTLITGRMACGNVGGERWQELHKSSGELWDYKLGRDHPQDPSSNVGSYRVDDVRNTVIYTYGGTSYEYQVCYVSGNNSYTFCGAVNGGRDITNINVGPSNTLTDPVDCNGVTSIQPPSVNLIGSTGARPRLTK